MQTAVITSKHKTQRATCSKRCLKLPRCRRPAANLPLGHRHRYIHAPLRKQSVGITGNEVAGAAAPICEGVVDVDGVVCAGAKGEGLGDGEGGIGGGTSGEEGGIEGGSVGCGAGGGFEGAAGGLKAVGRSAEDVGDGPGREARFEGGAGKRGGCADWGRGCG